MSNVFYDPEDFGLEQVAMIDYSDGSYQFDYRVIWRHKETGKFYTAQDSGCSCPSPFEEYNGLSDLEEYSFEAVKREAQERAQDSYYDGESVSEFIASLPGGA